MLVQVACLFVIADLTQIENRIVFNIYIYLLKLSYEQLRFFTLMKRCGVKQGLRKCWFHLQNEIKTRWGDSKNEIGFDVHHVYEHVVVHSLGSTYDS